MKYAVAALLVCAGTLATGRVLPGSFNDDSLRFGRFDSLTNVSLAHGVTAGPPAGPTPLPAPASDELWSKCKCKGEMLLRGMAATDAEAGQLLTPPRDSPRSEFNDWPADFDKWFWHRLDAGEVSEAYIELDDYWGIGDALRYLRLSDRASNLGRGGQWDVWFMLHADPHARDAGGNRLLPKDQEYEVQMPDGSSQKFPATGGYMAYAINAYQGAIIAMDRYAPKYKAIEDNLNIPDDKLPRLQKGSDISWGLWYGSTKVSPSHMRNIHYYFSLNISNKPTLEIIARAATLRRGRLIPWPGERISVLEERGKALLGTPNAVGMGYFLMQHKEELGQKTITAVRIFHCNSPGGHEYPCLCFEIGNV